MARQLGPGSQQRRLLHLRDQRRIADARRGEVLFPSQQIADRREETGVADERIGVGARGDVEAVGGARVAGTRRCCIRIESPARS